MPRLSLRFRPLLKKIVVSSPPVSPQRVVLTEEKAPTILEKILRSNQKRVGFCIGVFCPAIAVVALPPYISILMDEPEGDGKAWVFTKYYLYGCLSSLIAVLIFFCH